MEHPVNDPVHDRLRAARPNEAAVPDTAFDRELLERLMAQPMPHRHQAASRRLSPRRAVLAVAAVTAAAIALAGGPGFIGGPSAAPAAVTEAMRWFDPPAGTILHFRSELTSVTPEGGTREVVQELWQSADDPARLRKIERADGVVAESVGGDLYDRERQTIYVEVPARPGELSRALRHKAAAAQDEGADPEQVRRFRARASEIEAGKPVEADAAVDVGDPSVAEVRRLLARDAATVRGQEDHNGVRAWAITLQAGPAGEGAPQWTLWTAVADGRPLGLRIDSGPDTRVMQTVRWTDYEILPGDRAERLLTLTGAHPEAKAVRDPDRLRAARARLYPRG